MDKVVINGKGYELPTKTLDIADKIEELISIETDYQKGKIKARQVIQAEYDFLVLIFDDKVQEILNNQSLEECDINDVSLAVIKVIDAYNLRILQEKIKSKARILNNPEIKSLLNAVNKISND